MQLANKAAVTGVGDTDYTRDAGGRSALSLQLEAALKAVSDAGLRPQDIDGIVMPSPSSPVVAEELVTNLGIPDLRFSTGTPLGGAGPVAALQCAAVAIAAGICSHVLLSLGRTGRTGQKIGVRIQQMPQFRIVGEFEAPSGALAPAQYYAPMARRHMEMFGTTSRQLAEIAVTTRQHAILNGNARMMTPLSVQDHQASRMIADPLRLYDCSLESDGAAAVVVSAADIAYDLRQPRVLLAGMAEGHPDSPSAITQRGDMTRLG
jgi:acetyl-CoA acetyltransferase